MRNTGTATTLRSEGGKSVHISSTDERSVRLTAHGEDIELTPREAGIIASALLHAANISGGAE